MKILVSLICLALLSIGMPQEGSAAEADHIRLRAGLSTVSGLVGLEYQKNNIAVDVGWFAPAEGDVTFGGQKFKSDSLNRFMVGARYFMSPDTKGPFGALSFVLNDQATFILDTSDLSGDTEGFNSLYFTAGYRFLLGEKFDLTLGSGYGIALGLSDEAEALGADSGLLSFDLTLGFNIK